VKFISNLLIALAVLTLVAGPVAAQRRGRQGEEVNAGKYGWMTSLEEAKPAARQSGKPFMVVLRYMP
jgi:hypothetical protein